MLTERYIGHALLSFGPTNLCNGRNSNTPHMCFEENYIVLKNTQQCICILKLNKLKILHANNTINRKCQENKTTERNTIIFSHTVLIIFQFTINVVPIT